MRIWVVHAGKGNEVKLGENSASKEVSAGPQLRGTKPLPVAISLTGAPAGRADDSPWVRPFQGEALRSVSWEQRCKRKQIP